MEKEKYIKGIEHWDQARERLWKDIELLASAGFTKEQVFILIGDPKEHIFLTIRKLCKDAGQPLTDTEEDTLAEEIFRRAGYKIADE